MDIFDKGNRTYLFDATRTFNFKRFAHEASDFTLIEGFVDFRGLDSLAGRKIVHLEFEEPNRFFSRDPLFHHLAYEDYFYKTFTICPFTADWLNRKYGNHKRSFAFIPFNETLIPPKTDKKFDVIYAGHILSRELEDVALTLAKFAYRLIAPASHPLSTDPDLDYLKKIKLISESRIAIVHNVLFVDESHVANLHRNVPDWRDNEAYRLVPGKSLIGKALTKIRARQTLAPQVKSRLFDAAFCRALILCRRDPWNVVERFFEPEKEFVYYEPGRLEERIREILSDFDSYAPIIERAYERAVREYTTRAFFEKHLKHLH